LPIIRCGNREFRDIQGIVFDKDGTLEDSRAFWYDRAIARVQAIESQIPGLESLLTKTFGIGANSLNPAGLMGSVRYVKRSRRRSRRLSHTTGEI